MRDPIIGIDLGTSNTVVAHVDATGNPIVLADENGYKIHPSVVSFHPNGGVVVGAAAKQRKVIDPQNTIYSVKRLIGRSFRSPEVKTAMARSPFLIKEGENQGPLIVTRAGEFAIPEISAIVLDYARNVAAERLNSVSVNRAVVTVPASFNDAQRSATATAGSIANLQVVRVINEPTAAALAYGHTRNLNNIIAVYDFGGGTFDITILKLADQVYEVLGTAGDTFLGGDDLDERIVDKMVAKFLAENRMDLRTNEVGMMRLRAVAEQTKIELSRRSRAVVRIDEIAYGAKGKPLNLNIEITREEFVTHVADIIDRTFPVCQEALALAGLGIDQIDDIILVGGTTKIPYVRDQAARFFAKAPRNDVNPEDAVAIGAALQAASFERATGKSVAVGYDPADEPTSEQPFAQSDDELSAPTVAPSELATGAPRTKRPTATFGTPVNKPDTSYTVTRTGTKDVYGKTPPPPPAAPLGRMTRPITSSEVDAAKARTTAPGIGAQRAGTSPLMTQQLPIVQQPPAPSRTTQPRAATPPPIPQKTTRVPVPPRAPASTPLTSETSPSFSGEIETSPGLPAAPASATGGTGTFPGLVIPPSDSFTDRDQSVRFDSLADSAQGDSYTDADAVAPTKSWNDAAQLHRPSADFNDFETQEKLVPPAPTPSPGRPVPAALHNARTMIAPPPSPPAHHDTEFDDDQQQASAASTAKGLPPMPPSGLAPLGGPRPGGPIQHPRMHSSAMQPMPMPVMPMPVPMNPGAVPIMPAPVPASARAPVPPPVVSGPAEMSRAPVVLEVTPRGLGIGTVAGFCEELIRRNSRLPAAQKRMFTTSRDSQELVRIVVCQGESRRMDNNTVIGDLVLNDLPRRPRGETSIEVTFQLDASGILQVLARDPETGREQSASLDLVGGMQDVAASRDRIAALRR